MRIIGGTARGRKLLPPPGNATRPALDQLRESLFSIIHERVENARVLDLFAGVGAFGLEALSRGARHATFVEASPRTIKILRRNIENLGFQRQVSVLEGDALTVPPVEEPGGVHSVVFLDPPFAMFRDERAARRVFDRVRELLRRSAEGRSPLISLRLPSRYRGPLPFAAVDERVYGRSRLALIEVA